MNPWLIEIGLGALPVAVWFGLYGLARLATRPRGVQPLPATPELGPEPPALASLVASNWDLTEDAAGAILLDLGARRIIEFRQPDNDPRHTTVHIVQTNPAGLSRYEQRIFDRVRGLAIDGVVPLTALTFRDKRRARNWWKHLRAEIVADARSRGLSRPRFGRGLVVALVLAAAVAALGVAAGVLRHELRVDGEEPFEAAWSAGVVAWLVLSGVAARRPGERETPAGVVAAARWLAVRDWLRAHESFADLPPAAVAVWDRYLAYGAALGTTRVASAVIDMGMGDRKRVWSSYGGTWHRVRIRYPRGGRYGATPWQVVRPRLLAIVVGFVLLRWWWTVIGDLAGSGQVPDTAVRWSGAVQVAGVALGLLLLARGVHGLIRLAVDVATPLTVTGQVLWIDVWKVESGGEDSPSRPLVYYLAIDDGTSDQTTAWALPARLLGTCDTGDTVTVTARRWTRNVLTVSLVERGAAGHRDGSQPATEDPIVASLLGIDTAGDRQASAAPAGRRLTAGVLLTAEEVSQALGRPVVIVDTGAPRFLRMTAYASAGTSKPVMVLQVIEGVLGRAAWQNHTRGTRLPGIGDDAFLDGDRAVARCGTATVLLMLVGEGEGRGASLPELLGQAVARLPAAAAR